jgi:hypothetical protein
MLSKIVDCKQSRTLKQFILWIDKNSMLDASGRIPSREWTKIRSNWAVEMFKSDPSLLWALRNGLKTDGRIAEQSASIRRSFISIARVTEWTQTYPKNKLNRRNKLHRNPHGSYKNQMTVSAGATHFSITNCFQNSVYNAAFVVCKIWLFGSYKRANISGRSSSESDTELLSRKDKLAVKKAAWKAAKCR